MRPPPRRAPHVPSDTVTAVRRPCTIGRTIGTVVAGGSTGAWIGYAERSGRPGSRSGPGARVGVSWVNVYVNGRALPQADIDAWELERAHAVAGFLESEFGLSLPANLFGE